MAGKLPNLPGLGGTPREVANAVNHLINDPIALSRLETVAADTLVGNGTAGVASPTALTMAQVAALLGIPVLSSGTYAPTLTAEANCSALTLNAARYSRIGNIVTVSIALTLTWTADSTSTSLTATLPVAVTTMALADLAGSFSTKAGGLAGVARGKSTKVAEFIIPSSTGVAGTPSQLFSIFQYTVQ